MAFDINNLILAPQDGSCYAQPGWLCDFYFGYGCDVIEEDALNEKYRIQVLRILITKTDTEINELEKDLVSLQSELAWVEYEEWSDICCNALRKKIDSLYISVVNLKSKDKNNTGVHLSKTQSEEDEKKKKKKGSKSYVAFYGVEKALEVAEDLRAKAKKELDGFEQYGEKVLPLYSFVDYAADRKFYNGDGI